jgi:hypothetical protein
MGTIKDLVDLVTQLANSAEGRKISSELLKIQQLTLALQSEQASLHEANIELREERQQLRDSIRTLEAKITEMSAQTGSGPTDVPMCPNCSTASRPFYMIPVPPDFIEVLNATHECPKCNYNTRSKS